MSSKHAQRIHRVGELMVLGVDGGNDTGVALVRARPQPPGEARSFPIEVFAHDTLRGKAATRADELRDWLAEHVPAWGEIRADQLGLCASVEGVAYYGGPRSRGIMEAAMICGYYRGALESLCVPTLDIDAPRVRTNLGVRNNAPKRDLWARTYFHTGQRPKAFDNEHERDAVAVACASWNLWEKVLESRP